MECRYRASGTVFTQRFGLPYFNNISHTLASGGVCYYHSIPDHNLLLQDLQWFPKDTCACV